MEADPVADQTGNTDTLQQPGANTRHSLELGTDILTTFTIYLHFITLGLFLTDL